MPNFKSFADLLTSIRALIVPILIWLGFNQGESALNTIVLLMLISWISDYFDGLFARKHPFEKQTWIGAHDLQIDVLVGSSLLIYLTVSGFVAINIAMLYLVGWWLFFLIRGMPKSYGAVFQAPIYLFLLWLAWQLNSWALIYVITWLVGNILYNWRRLFATLIPEFFAGLRGFRKRRNSKTR
jgi:hypothetical protein